jgi:hypothetical protein
MMIWAGLHGYIGLRRSIPDGPFPPTADYVKRLVDAHAPSVAPPD